LSHLYLVIKRWIEAKNRILILCFTMLYMQSCITTPFLKKGQHLLINQKVKGNRGTNTEDLELLYRQKANRKILGLTPYLAFYFFGKSIWDTTRTRKQIKQKIAYYDHKIKQLPIGSSQDSIRLEAKKEKKCKKLYINLLEGNWWMRVVGEPPAIFDSSKAKETVLEIQKFLFNKGYFDALVNLRIDTIIGGNVSVKYLIKENTVHRIRHLEYLTNDFRIRRLLDSAKSSMSLKVGNDYQKENIVADRDAIEKLLRNKGYFSFSRDYINVKVDTLAAEPKTNLDSLLFKKDPALFSRLGLDLKLTIQNPEDGQHKSYVMDSISFTLNESDSSKIGFPDTIRYNQVDYLFQTQRKYSLGILDSKILVHPKQYFHNARLTNTQAQLSGMDMFRYVNLSLDTNGQKMNLRITANRLPKYQTSNEIGLLMSQGSPGPYFNTGFKIRNIFGGFEVFELNFRYSQEGQLSTFLPSDVVFRARDLSVTGAFTISSILFPIKLSPKLYEYNPKTRFIFSINAIKRPEYIRNLLKGALVYSVQLSQSSQIGISPIDVTVNITPPNALNPNYLQQLILFSGLGQSVLQSFQSAIVTNFNAYYMYNDNFSGSRKRAKYFRLNVEYGGELLHRVLSDILDRKETTIGDFKTFRYFRTTSDFRFYQPTSKRTLVAFRVSGGVSIPIGNSTILPWEKYNFAGGSSSIRAWLPRRLGPGSFLPEGATNPNDLRTEQPGELILEASVEVRRKIIGFFEGALFADAGNVWSIYKDVDRPGAEFTPLFIRQVALGGGIGFRFDFSFLIIRIDAATKIYNPAFQNFADKWTIQNISWKKPFGSKGQTLLNVGIGYPF